MKLPPEVHEYFQKISKMGGKARARKLTREQRQEIGRKAAKARWAKEKDSRQVTKDSRAPRKAIPPQAK